MKSKLAKAAAITMAMTMCVPVSAFAADTSTSSGSFNTSFDVYSPALTIQVPVNAEIRVNPLADSGDATVKKFTVASNSIDIWNASVDVEADAAIPVNATVKATITTKKNDVTTEYNTFNASATSTKKRINLNLSQAQSPATLAVKSGDVAEFDTTTKKLKLGKYEVSGDATYTTPVQSVPITKYGSLLSVDIAGPSTTDGTTGKTFSTDPTKVSATVGSFAVTGTANVSADWKADDIAVAITYDVRASQPRNIATPAIATAPTFSSSSASDVTITIPATRGEATVAGIGVHNDGEGLYGDYIWADDAYTVAYNTDGTATVKIPKTDSAFTFLAGDDYKGKAQDLVIVLSDGRTIVSTLTVN